MTETACVYTALFGDYEVLNEQPVRRNSHLRFICFTDDPGLKSDSWEIVQAEPLFSMDPIRSQRQYKMLPHRFLPEYSVSLYIDNAVLLKQPPDSMLADQLSDCDFALPSHSFRKSVLDEFLEVARLGLDDPSRVFEQLNHYEMIEPSVLEEKPYWCGMLFRRHDNPGLRKTMDLWLSHVYRYSRRDQLSFNLSCTTTGFTPKRISIDNYNSDFHEWPIHQGRDRSRGTRSISASLVPAHLQLRHEVQAHHDTRQLLSQETEARGHVQELLSQEVGAHKRTLELLNDEIVSHACTRATLAEVMGSMSWRMTEPLRKLLYATTWSRGAIRWLLRRS